MISGHRNNSDSIFNLEFGLVGISLCKHALDIGAFSQ